MDTSLVFQLQRPPVLSGRLTPFLLIATVLAAMLAIGAADALWAGAALSDVAGQLVVVGLLMVAAATVVGRRMWARSRPDPQIVLRHDAIALPLSIESTQARPVAYGDIRSVAMGGPPGRVRLLIETVSRVYLFNERDFARAEDPVQLLTALRSRIVDLPDGDSVIDQMRQRQAFTQRALTVRPWVTQALLGINVVFFANQALSAGAVGDPMELIRWGAISAPLVRDGELFRLVSGGFLHGGWLHLLLNAIGLYLLGGILERLIGSWRFALIYLGAGLVATASSAFIAAPPVSVGASGAVFGLLGALAAMNWRYGDQMPLPFRQPPRVWLFLIGANVALPLMLMLAPYSLPQIDVMAHGGGFIAGLAVAAAMYVGHREVSPNEPTHAALKGSAVALAGLYLVGLAQGVSYAARFDDESSMEVLQTWRRDTAGLGPQYLNLLAWYGGAILEDADKETLEAARREAQRAVDTAPDIAALRDTLATVHYRLGDLDQAVQEQNIVMRSEGGTLQAFPGRVYATQLARFLEARVARSGPIPPDAAATARLKVAGEQHIELELLRDAGNGMTIDALVYRGEERVGLLRVELGPGAERRYPLEPSADTKLELRKDLRFRVAMVHSGLPPNLAGAPIEWRYWPTDPEVAAYP